METPKPLLPPKAEKDGSLLNSQEDEHGRKHGHMGRFFAKVFHHESKGMTHEDSTDHATTRSISVDTHKQAELPSQNLVPSTVTPPPPNPCFLESSNVNADETPLVGKTTIEPTFGSCSPKTRRSQAEARLQKSAESLNQAIAKVSGIIRVPDAITLQNVEEVVDNIPQTARSIEVAIDAFIDARQYKVAIDARAVWKSCASNLFRAFYPYVKSCLSEIGVFLLEIP